ncbi:MAG: nicotinamide riboside transporter PnuC [Breznakibacter sp.]
MRIDWDFDRAVELTATVLSLVYLYLEIKEKKLLWFFGIVSSALYAWVFFHSHFYADFGLSVYYVVISVYGWVHWGKMGDNTGLPIKNITTKTLVGVAAATVLCYLSLLGLLLYMPEYLGLASSALPFVDSFTVAASITATWMLSQKIIQHWYVWILVNAISVAMFGVKGLYFTSGLYVVYTAGSIIGLMTWRRHFLDQCNTLNG